MTEEYQSGSPFVASLEEYHRLLAEEGKMAFSFFVENNELTEAFLAEVEASNLKDALEQLTDIVQENNVCYVGGSSIFIYGDCLGEPKEIVEPTTHSQDAIQFEKFYILVNINEEEASSEILQEAFDLLVERKERLEQLEIEADEYLNEQLAQAEQRWENAIHGIGLY